MLWMVLGLACAGVAAWSLATQGRPADSAAGEGTGSTPATTAVGADAGAASTSIDEDKRAAYCDNAAENGDELAALAASLDAAGIDADPELFELRWVRFLSLMSEFWDQAPTGEVQEAWRALAAPYYAIEPVVRAARYDLGDVPVGDVERFTQAVAAPEFGSAKQTVAASWSTHCGRAVAFPAV
jgi:hypothetical protein